MAAATLSQSFARWARLLTVPVLALVVWELLVRAGVLEQGLIPSPTSIASEWHTWIFGARGRMLNLYSGTWLGNIGFSASRVLQGFALGASAGVVIGVLIGQNRWAASLLDPSIQLIRPIPITAWLPISVALFGLSAGSALFLIALGAFFPVVINTVHGVRETRRTLVRAARMMGCSRARLVWRVVLPSALPNIITGLRLGMGVAWVCIIVAEMIAVQSGLGYVLWDAYYFGRMEIVVADMISIGLLGLLSDRIILLLSRPLLRWQTLEAHSG
ncbi:MAG: ABC transporter permease [Gammaproteobacteria bacterium]|nr:ABC transporter permease [Gammaproteobacteria bacterium]